jgi:hypothetical protein
VLTYPLTAFLIEAYGWQRMFACVAALGAAWAAAFLAVCASSPAAHPSIHPAELARLALGGGGGGDDGAPPPIPWGPLLRCRAAWAIFIGHFAFNWSAPATCRLPPPPPFPRTNRTSLVPPLVLSGHVSSTQLPRATQGAPAAGRA